MTQKLMAIMVNDAKMDLYIGTTAAEFEVLYQVFEPALLAAGGRQPGTAYKATKFVNRIRFFYLVLFVRSNLTSSMGELALDWARASINKDTRHCARVMVPALREAIGNLWFQPGELDDNIAMQPEEYRIFNADICGWRAQGTGDWGHQSGGRRGQETGDRVLRAGCRGLGAEGQEARWVQWTGGRVLGGGGQRRGTMGTSSAINTRDLRELDVD
jgi:hypothetical protein